MNNKAKICEGGAETFKDVDVKSQRLKVMASFYILYIELCEALV